MIHQTQKISFLCNKSKTGLKSFFQRSIPLSSDCCPWKHVLLKRSQNSSSSCWKTKVCFKLYHARGFYCSVFAKISIFCKYSECVANFNKPFFKFASNDQFNQLLVGLFCGFQFFLVRQQGFCCQIWRQQEFSLWKPLQKPLLTHFK